jgi:hypothetical protein
VRLKCGESDGGSAARFDVVSGGEHMNNLCCNAHAVLSMGCHHIDDVKTVLKRHVVPWWHMD